MGEPNNALAVFFPPRYTSQKIAISIRFMREVETDGIRIVIRNNGFTSLFRKNPSICLTINKMKGYNDVSIAFHNNISGILRCRNTQMVKKQQGESANEE